MRAWRDYWEARARNAESISQGSPDLQDRLNAAESELVGLRSRLSLRLANRAATLRHKILTKASRSATGTEQQTPASRPAFSVLITVFDNGPCLLDAVRSIKAQTLPDWEIIIWNDGSSDPATLEALQGLPSERIRVVNSTNQGVIHARNGAAAQSSGEFLVFLDPDDELEPTYLEKALITFTRFPGVDLVIPNTRVESQSAAPYWSPLHFEERRIAYENTAPISTAMRRRSLGLCRRYAGPRCPRGSRTGPSGVRRPLADTAVGSLTMRCSPTATPKQPGAMRPLGRCAKTWCCESSS